MQPVKHFNWLKSPLDLSLERFRLLQISQLLSTLNLI